MNTRVRLAPSPTGSLHIGTARTALYNYLFAKKQKGTFVLRIEDTDRSRSTKEYEDNIKDGLKWLGLGWDEGIDTDGNYGPYRQMERLLIYKKYINQLLAEDKTYPCYCTTEELEAERKDMEAKKQPPKYSGTCSELTEQQRVALKKEGRVPVIRFRIPKNIGKRSYTDLIRGKIEEDISLYGDFVIVKSDGVPLYNIANVIDDHEMKMTHTIRGEDLLPSTIKQILLYEALGWKPPEFAHIPLILNADRTKMSKRKNHATVNWFRENGYLPEALLNFIVLLGWNPKTNEEVFALHELVERFDLAQVHKSGAIFDQKKLDWLNSQHIKRLDLEDLTQRMIPYLIEDNVLQPMYVTDEPIATGYGTTITETYLHVPTQREVSFTELMRIVNLIRDRLITLRGAGEACAFYFEVQPHEVKDLNWKDNSLETTTNVLQFSYKLFENTKDADWTKDMLEKIFFPTIEKSEWGNGDVLYPLRVALTGLQRSPGPFEIAETLGKKETLHRVQQALQKIA